MKKVLVGLVALALALAACGDDDGSSSGPESGAGFSVLAALGEVPAGIEGPIEVGDIAAAIELAGVTRTDGRDSESLSAWLMQVTGGPIEGGTAPVFVPVAEELGVMRWQLTEEFHEELGWSIVDVDWFVAAGHVPTRFAIAGGTFGDEALAGLPEVADGVVTAGEGDDYYMDLESRTAARILGDPLRLARDGDRIAISKSTRLVQMWLGGGPSLADDPDLASVAEVLDETGVVGAFLYPMGADEGPDVLALGLGWNVDGETPVVTVVHRFAGEASADEVRADWEEALTMDGRHELTDVTVDGQNAVVTLRVLGGPPSRTLHMMMDRTIPYGP